MIIYFFKTAAGKGNISAQLLPAHVQCWTAVVTHPSIRCPKILIQIKIIVNQKIYLKVFFLNFHHQIKECTKERFERDGLFSIFYHKMKTKF